MATNIPADHPRARSLQTRERMKAAVEEGLVHMTGLIAHGRGEAFDYLLGEKTGPVATAATRKAAAVLLAAERPVLSLNGNVVALAAPELVTLAKAIPATLEVNLFHHTPERVRKLIQVVQDAGADRVLGDAPDMRIPGLASDRGPCHSDGIGGADVILVPLEDGDRCEALKKMGKTVITIDLNPLSRTAKTADVTICDELTRTVEHITTAVLETKAESGHLDRLRTAGVAAALLDWDNQANLRAARDEMIAVLREG
ncbi:MAG: phosphopantothenate/pantothenate synthetase [Euryarchaeota archaeon]|nr:phosphopantothenate/pantothenate synthetase [Euryarchaeota archaeon]